MRRRVDAKEAAVEDVDDRDDVDDVDDCIEMVELPTTLRSGGEVEMQRSFIEFYRAVLLRKCAGLTVDQLRLTRAPSTMSLGGLLYHCAFAEDWWWVHRFLGEPVPEPWDKADWDADPDWEWTLAASLPAREIAAQYTVSARRVDAAMDTITSGSQMAALVDERGVGWDARRILTHIVEELARHAGHADLLREWIDGRTGD